MILRTLFVCFVCFLSAANRSDQWKPDCRLPCLGFCATLDLPLPGPCQLVTRLHESQREAARKTQISGRTHGVLLVVETTVVLVNVF